MCGDQSAGKSSVLEALTEIPFPRNDNLCTRYATEIILRRAATNSLTIKVIPDTKRPAAEQTLIKAFNESITDFTELSRIMSKATDLMGLDSALKSGTLLKARAFAKDILSIEIEGPSRPQLTLVDIPGLIQTETKGVTKADVDMVTEITDQYISQPRTICLAVVSAANDYANQGILTKVRKVDPDGERTLGIITKPDRLPSGSGSEAAYLALASNKDIFFKLGWHVIKNRSFEEGDASFEERNASEATYFSKSNFKSLPPDCVGIDPLRLRLSALLFEHVKKELPKLREDLEEALSDTKVQLDKMGNRRTTPSDCRTYLAKLSLDYYEICKSAVNGHYESGYFTSNVDPTFTVTSPATIRRVRAVVQYMNTQFSNRLRTTGHKYHINMVDVAQQDDIDPLGGLDAKSPDPNPSWPIKTSKRDALKWVGQVLTRTRGKELVGNFNPLLIGELFWEQCSKWRHFATVHVQQVAQVCSRFLEILLQDKCPADVRARLWSSQIQEGLQARDKAAFRELDKIMEDIQNYPINYNHYYTDTIRKQLQTRQKASLAQCIKDATTRTLLHDCNKPTHTSTSIDIHQVIESYSGSIDPDMENVSCEEALDCLLSIYKVYAKLVPTFKLIEC